MKFTYASGDRPLEGYTIRRGIGRGGFGEVYYATSDAGKEVAIKLVQRNFEVELRGVSQCLNLKHPNLITVYDVRTAESGEHWVVMEYVDGESLEAAIDRNPQGMSREEVGRWLEGIAGGVGYLHDKGVVHRDLKPANIFLEDGFVKICDYGLSKFISVSRRSGQTESVGTVHYMAPEVVNGRYGKEIDLYALGIIVYEMLTGRVPFEGESVGEILMKHLTAEPDVTPLPEPYRHVVARLLHKDPGRRYASVQDMLADLNGAGGRVGEWTSARSSVAEAAASVVAVGWSGQIARAPRPADAPGGEELRHTQSWYSSPLAGRVAGVERSEPPALPEGHRRDAGATGRWHGTAQPDSAGASPSRLGGGTVAPALLDKPAGPSAAPALLDKPALAPANPLTLDPRCLTTDPRPLTPDPRSLTATRVRELLVGMLVSVPLAAVLAWVVGAMEIVDFTALNRPDGFVAHLMFVAAVTVAEAWVVLGVTKLCERRLRDEAPVRALLAAGGIAVGLFGYWLQSYLALGLESTASDRPGVGGASLVGMDVFPFDLPAGAAILWAVYFASLLVVPRWWKHARADRGSRLCLVPLLAAFVWSYLLVWLWPFPRPWGVLIAVLTALTVQLSSPAHARAPSAAGRRV